MAEHTPGRLILDYDGYTPCSESGEAICRMPSPEYDQDPVDVANACQIILSWNAVRDIPANLLKMVDAPDLPDEPLSRLYRLRLAVEAAQERAFDKALSQPDPTPSDD